MKSRSKNRPPHAVNERDPSRHKKAVADAEIASVQTKRHLSETTSGFNLFYLLLPPANEVWGKVIFLHQFVILFTGGCMVAPGGGAWLFRGRTWLFGGVCMVLFRGGMHGFIRGWGHAWLFGGACMVLFRGHAWFYSGVGGHAWFYSGGMSGFSGVGWGGMRGFIWGHAWFFWG